MKLQLYVCTLLAAAGAASNEPDTAAVEQQHHENIVRDDIPTVTDIILFNIDLPKFVDDRTRQRPKYLVWTSDGCTDAPDNPFGFNYEPACYRHDFGYNNYRPQHRFTKENKKRIDDNFKDDLHYQCRGVRGAWACRALANVYYFAVRSFGGQDARRQVRAVNSALLEKYDELVRVYEDEVRKAQALGHLPMHTGSLKEKLDPLRLRVGLSVSKMSEI
ncbi:hypothetical protein E4U19_002574 [Claviceps sp. Clav32 group G5]|nr:hypothetical protein E4U19_002574 [Claviceps sp. Clav32 group G5]KAG6029762.1 hypothetical protein E4U40_000320 [Claviceps sp. LM458 group G5]KAG6046934.1 hypothetical protein E4U39_000907 [Claviceps sp. Clav50 group G5]